MRKGDETKREILRAAEQLFCQKGYEAASMQDSMASSSTMQISSLQINTVSR